MTGIRSQRPIHPSGSAGGYPIAPWLVLGACVGAAGLAWLAWLAGRLAALMSGRPWDTGPEFGWEFVALVRHGRWAQLWPDVPPPLVGGMLVVLLAVVIVPAGWGFAWWQARRPQAGDPLRSMARPGDVTELTGGAAFRRAQRLRPSLAGTKAADVPPAAVGIAVGELVTARRRRRLVLRSSWEDVLLAVMAPRAGKTTALAVPPILDAPGPVLATSNRSDVWAATNRARARVGDVWLFDPQRVTRQSQQFWVDLLGPVTTVEEAARLAEHFIQEIRGVGSSDPFWPLAAGDLLACLFLAAAHSGGTLADVQAWLSDVTSREPATLLRAAGFPQAARALTGRQTGAPETRDGVYETARTAARCLTDPDIMAWVTPPSSDAFDQFDISGFATSRDSLYLLSKEGAGAAAPLVAALTDAVLRAAVVHAEAAGGRIDPPVLAVLDEAANICKISDLPQLYSHLGGRGIIPITIIQNIAQGQGVWGDRGMTALWSAATVKLIGAGLDDARHVEDVSRLIGEHDVAVATINRDANGYTSYSTSPQRRRILEPGDLRALPRGRAILLATGARAAMINLMPWYTGEHAQTIGDDTADSVDAITRRARVLLDKATDDAS